MAKPKKRFSTGLSEEETRANNSVPDIDVSLRNKVTSKALVNVQKTAATKIPPKEKKAVRRTFSMLDSDSSAIDEVIRNCAKTGEVRGRSDVIRAGIAMLLELGEAAADELRKIEKLK